MKCDRCHEEIKGFRDAGITAGFYDVRNGYWALFGNKGEKDICDACMFIDPRYIAIYGERNG